MSTKKKLILAFLCFAAAQLLMMGVEASAQQNLARLNGDLAIYPYKIGEIVYEPRVAPSQEAIEAGKKVYDLNCARCHGLKGDGKGPVSYLLSPKPRDFTIGTFKLRSTESGQLPTDEDLFRSVAAGIPGSGMPPWKDKLSVEEIWEVVYYVKRFYPNWQEDVKLDPLKKIAVSPPPKFDQAAVASGKEIYRKVKCSQCHGDSGVGDGPSSNTLKDDWGQKIVPGDMTKPWSFRSGARPGDIYRAFTTGLNGTPMPSFREDLNDFERWQLVSYILSIAGEPPKPIMVESGKGLEINEGMRKASQIGSRLGKPDVVIDLVSSAWETWPKEVKVKKGQVVEVRVWSTDNGLGPGYGHGFAIDGYDDRVFVNGVDMDTPKAVRFVADKPGEFDFYCATQCDPGQLSSTQKSMGIWGHAFMGGAFIVEE